MRMMSCGLNSDTSILQLCLSKCADLLFFMLWLIYPHIKCDILASAWHWDNPVGMIIMSLPHPTVTG